MNANYFVYKQLTSIDHLQKMGKDFYISIEISANTSAEVCILSLENTFSVNGRLGDTGKLETREGLSYHFHHLRRLFLTGE